MKTWWILAGALVAASCSKGETAAQAAVPGAKAPAPTAQAAAGELRGKVAERLDAANYTYLRITKASGETWAAVPATPVAVGTEVVITNPMAMPNFESKALGRKFPELYFGSGAAVVGADGKIAEAPPAAAPNVAPAAAAVPTDVKAEKAEGPEGRTISELWAQKDALKAKSIAIRGRVVKYTPGVLGKNWLHLRDGSGSDQTRDNDVTVTTQDTAAVGDLVLIKGTVQIDKDFGAGYAYPVIVEDAKIVR